MTDKTKPAEVPTPEPAPVPPPHGGTVIRPVLPPAEEKKRPRGVARFGDTAGTVPQ